MRNLAEEHRRLRAGGWQTTTGMTLSGKTLGLLGLGRVGKRMAEYAKAFGMDVIAWSQNLTEEAAAVHGVRRVDKPVLSPNPMWCPSTWCFRSAPGPWSARASWRR